MSDEKSSNLAKEHALAREEQKRRHRMLGLFLSFYLKLPLPMKIVFMVFGILYSPAMVQNLAACVEPKRRGDSESFPDQSSSTFTWRAFGVCFSA